MRKDGNCFPESKRNLLSCGSKSRLHRPPEATRNAITLSGMRSTEPKTLRQLHLRDNHSKQKKHSNAVLFLLLDYTH